MPYVLEVAKIFQHVHPKPRTIPMTVINKSMKTRLQTIDRRIQRLEELLPQIKLRRNEKLSQEIECLNQKLRFLHKRMQVADSRSCFRRHKPSVGPLSHSSFTADCIMSTCEDVI